MVGKLILQQLCASGLGWDDPIPEHIASRFHSWCLCLPELQSIKIPRCIYSSTGYKFVEFHHFCDASSSAYGVCSYIRLIDCNDVPQTSLVFGKSRVAPLKPITIPRLELNAALLAVKISRMLDLEFQYDDAKHFFYTDSQVVLSYIANSSRRFHVFVANRVGYIQSHTSVSQWKHVKGIENPADIASRGLLPLDLQTSSWFKGPSFLNVSGPTIPEPVFFPVNSSTDVEVKSNVSKLDFHDSFSTDHFSHISNFWRLLRVVARILILFTGIKRSLRMGDLFRAQIAIVTCI